MANELDAFVLLDAASTGDTEAVQTLLRQSVSQLQPNDGCLASYLNVSDSTNKTALWLAVERENAVAVRTLVAAGADVNKTYHSRRTALMFAAERDKADFVQVMVDNGAELDLVDSFGMSALMIAVERGSLECLDNLIIAGASLTLRDIRGKTALMIAVEGDRPECLQRLLEAGADLTSPDSRGMSPLMTCISKGHDRCLRTLIQAGAALNVVDRKSRTPIMFAVEENSVACLKELIHAGADKNIGGHSERTAVMLAACKGHVEALLSLIEAGADLNSKDTDGWTALMLAADAGSVECVQTLVNNGARADVVDKKGKTAHLIATISGNHSCLQTLLNAGSHVIDLSSHSGKTALMYASEILNENCLQVLVKAGADLNMRDARGKTALMCVVYETLKGARGSEIDLRCLSGCIQILLEAGADVDSRDREGKTALMYAAQSCVCMSVTMLPLLINAGASVNLVDNQGRSALSYAAETGNLKCIRSLVASGASVNVRDITGKSALHHLTQHHDDLKCEQSVEFLVANHADVNAQDNDGMTALMHAAKLSASTKILDLLTNHGAEINAVDNLGGSAIVYSLGSDKKCLEQVRFLLNKGANPNNGTLLGKSAVAMAVRYRHFDLLKLLVENGTEPKMDWEDFRFLVMSGLREILQFLIIQGLSPLGVIPLDQCQAQLVSRYSTLDTALTSGHVGVARFFLATCYLNQHDVIYRHPKDNFETDTRRRRRFTSKLTSDPQVTAFLSQVYAQPWPLVKLCFVTVSAALGPSPGRQGRVEKSQLPVILQKMLLHQDRVNNLCVQQWDMIQMSFNPDQYENLPKPRPLLYYWPFGRELGPCDCKGCGQKGYKFVF